MQYQDNILTPSVFLKITETLNHATMPFYYVQDTSGMDNPSNKDWEFSWSHGVYDSGEVRSDLCPLLETAFLTMLDNTGQRLGKLLRIRVGLITRTPQAVLHGAHIDFPEPHKTALLYLNDTNGETVIYKERYDESSGLSNEEYLARIGEPTIASVVECKANRFMWFDGLHYHTSRSQTDVDRRMVVTYNYTGS